MLHRGRAHATVVLLDACRTNAPRFLDSGGSNGAARDGRRGMGVAAVPLDFGLAEGPQAQARGVVVAFACGDGQVAYDGDAASRNGVFTANLLRFMAPGRSVDAILDAVAQGVQEDTAGQQTPAKHMNTEGGSIFLAPPTRPAGRIASLRLPSLRRSGGDDDGGPLGAALRAASVAAKLALGAAAVFAAVKLVRGVASAQRFKRSPPQRRRPR